jgi:hypothetical protein
MEQDSTPASSDSTKPLVLLAGVGILVLLVTTLPLFVVAAVVCGVPAALWWLSSAQQSASTGATGEASASQVRYCCAVFSHRLDERLWGPLEEHQQRNFSYACA